MLQSSRFQAQPARLKSALNVIAVYVQGTLRFGGDRSISVSRLAAIVMICTPRRRMMKMILILIFELFSDRAYGYFWVNYSR